MILLSLRQTKKELSKDLKFEQDSSCFGNTSTTLGGFTTEYLQSALNSKTEVLSGNGNIGQSP
jgi:hypothetical protein